MFKKFFLFVIFIISQSINALGLIDYENLIKNYSQNLEQAKLQINNNNLKAAQESLEAAKNNLDNIRINGLADIKLKKPLRTYFSVLGFYSENKIDADENEALQEFYSRINQKDEEIDKLFAATKKKGKVSDEDAWDALGLPKGKIPTAYEILGIDPASFTENELRTKSNNLIEKWKRIVSVQNSDLADKVLDILFAANDQIINDLKIKQGKSKKVTDADAWQALGIPKDKMPPTAYEILGVDPANFTENELRAKYKDLNKKWNDIKNTDVNKKELAQKVLDVLFPTFAQINEDLKRKKEEQPKAKEVSVAEAWKALGFEERPTTYQILRIDPANLSEAELNNRYREIIAKWQPKVGSADANEKALAQKVLDIINSAYNQIDEKLKKAAVWSALGIEENANNYEILGIDPDNFTEAELNNKYRQLSARWQAQLGTRKALAQKILDLINNAYKQINDNLKIIKDKPKNVLDVEAWTALGFAKGKEPNSYEILDVSQDVTRQQLENEYRRLKTRWSTKKEAIAIHVLQLIGNSYKEILKSLEEAGKKQEQDITKQQIWDALGVKANPTYLQILGLKPGASDDEIKKAFRRLRVKWHPTRNLDNQNLATAVFNEIGIAFDKLGFSKEKTPGEK